MFITKRKAQYWALQKNEDLKKSMIFVMHNRSYVLTPKSVLNKSVNKRRRSQSAVQTQKDSIWMIMH